MSYIPNIQALTSQIGVNSYTATTGSLWTGNVFCGISHTMFRLHDTMDIRVSAGLETSINKNKLQTMEPVIKVEENNWTLSTDLSGKWRVSYLL